ncbi:hypothetical protein O7632_13930 [Solwaraspora sp. WMMD406]|uniref:hypothetical protein n=1 Tax=Solwaraspora sp. WMMD406 TaxID=3016095 RepID=UPI0024163856|nr:hypothetical protein [Solwaraspora sp. WMMD406]MDG4765185.1 hypothetical protein [Solwaraspora sp. WMMD406]
MIAGYIDVATPTEWGSSDMVYVKLDKDWTDGSGVSHAAGEMVDIDAATLAKLQQEGIVDESEWIGPTGDKVTTNWIGPTSTQP